MTYCTVKCCSNDTLFGEMMFKWYNVGLNDVQVTGCTVKWCSNDTLYG